MSNMGPGSFARTMQERLAGRQPRVARLIGRPAPSARVVLVTDRPCRIALVLGDIVQHQRGILRGCAAYAAQHPEVTFVFDLARRIDAPIWMPLGRCDGVLVGGGRGPLRDRIAAAGLPLVSIGFPAGADRYPTVHGDNVETGRLVAGYFLARGYRRFALIGQESTSWRIRCDGFRARVAEADPTLVVDRFHAGPDEDPEGLAERCARWLAELPRPCAVHAMCDLLGRRVLQVCVLLGIGVPEEIAIVANGDDDLLKGWATPALSTVSSNAEQQAWAAMDLLRRLVGGEPPPVAPVLVPPGEVVTRGSSDVHAIDDPAITRAMRFIIDRAAEGLQVGEVAAAVGVAKRTLERRFARAMGRPVAAEIRRVQLDRALVLLHDPHLSVTQVAERCGFYDASHFGRSFRRALGVTPTQWRAAHADG